MRRLAKNVKGVGLPGHFVVRYDDVDYAAWMDPFHGGRLLDLADCCRLAQVEEIEIKALQAVNTRHVVIRMLNNLRGIYFARKDAEKALEILDLLIAAAPESADEHKQRGVALLQQQRTREAMSAFQRYLDLSPEARIARESKSRFAIFRSGWHRGIDGEKPGSIPRIGQKQYCFCDVRAGYNPIWSVAAREGRPIIFDPTLKNEGVGSSSAGVLVPAG